MLPIFSLSVLTQTLGSHSMTRRHKVLEFTSNRLPQPWTPLWSSRTVAATPALECIEPRLPAREQQPARDL
jgi:hypothetical protein